MKSILTVALFICLFNHSFVQAKTNADEEVLKKYVQAFAKIYGDFGKTKNKEAVLSYMAPDVQATLVVTELNGQVKTIDSDYAGFTNHLNKIQLSEGLNINYKLINIPKVQIKGDIGVVIYEAEYQQEKSGEIWSAGRETVALTLKKFNKLDWKIIHYTTVGFENEKYKGLCICQLEELATGKYQSQTTIPAGKSYNVVLHEFDYTPDKQDRIIVLTNKFEKPIPNAKKGQPQSETVTEKYTFRLTFAGQLYLLKGKHFQTGQLIDTQELLPENLIGTTPNKEEVAMQSLQKLILKEICTFMRYRQ